MRASDREATIRRYQARLARHGLGARALGWDKGRQQIRFAAALHGLDTGFASILDMGCGLGDLFGYLRRLGWKGRYLGLDIVPEFVAEARRRFGADGAEFRELELSSQALRESFEVSVAIGVFNHRLRQGSWDDLRAMFRALWRHSSLLVAVDFLSATAAQRRPELRYWDAGSLLRFGLSHSKRVTLAHDYMPFEFTLQVWRDDSFTRACPAFRPQLRSQRPLGTRG